MKYFLYVPVVASAIVLLGSCSDEATRSASDIGLDATFSFADIVEDDLDNAEETIDDGAVDAAAADVDISADTSNDLTDVKDEDTTNNCLSDEECIGVFGEVGQCEAIRCIGGVCSIDNLPDGTACNASTLFCTDDACEGGICVEGVPSVLSDGDPCTEDKCVKGIVAHSPTAEPVQCDDNDPCTQNDVCFLGTCTGGSQVECPTEPCTSSASCQDGACVTVWKPEGALCDDNNPCTDVDICTASHACVSASGGEDCDDNNPCTDDACDLASGCVHTSNAIVCDDGDPCTLLDVCEGGVCIGGETLDCDDGIACTADACSPASGCVHTTDDSLCDDNNACTQDSCNELLGCENSPLVDGSACCILDADCSDGIPCTTDTCDATLGCIREPNDAACNDADSCTDDVCVPDFGCANPPAKEICDDIDNDCDGETDEEVGGPGTCGCLGEPCPPGFGCTVFGTCEALDEVYIPAGSFWRGCNEALDPYCSGGNNYNDHPQMLVTVPAFFIDRTEVTAAEYQACVNAGVCTVPFTTSAYATYGVAMLHDHPMNHVRWSQAGEYCAWSGKAEGVQRLCTESEWAMAARGSCTIHGEPCNELMPTYPWGEETPNCTLVVMNTCTNETQPVDSKPAGASPYGVLGMAGNVQEWVQDCFNYFTYAPTDGSANEDSPCTRVRRAGSWIVSGGQLRAGYRISGGSALNDEYTGFRCCRSAP